MKLSWVVLFLCQTRVQFIQRQTIDLSKQWELDDDNYEQ